MLDIIRQIVYILFAVGKTQPRKQYQIKLKGVLKMKKYEIEVFKKTSVGRVGDRVRDLECVLFANNKAQAVELAKDIIGAVPYNSVFTDSDNKNIIGWHNVHGLFHIYAHICKEC